MTSGTGRYSRLVRIRPSRRRASSGMPIRCVRVDRLEPARRRIGRRGPERGNCRSRTRNGRPGRRGSGRGSCAGRRPARHSLRSTVDHGGPGLRESAGGDESARSCRHVRGTGRGPRTPRAWSRLIVESTMPLTRRARSRTQAGWRAQGRDRRGSKPPQRFHAVLMASHSSVETVSRARRAFSRAARQAPAIELECSSSKTSRSQTVAYETGASPGSRPMITWRMTRAGEPLGLAGLLEHLQAGGVDDAGGPVGALDVAADPEQRLRDPAQHDASSRPRRTGASRTGPCCCCCCCCCWANESSREVSGAVMTTISRVPGWTC